ncbi:MAG: hypothetical protein ACO3JL_04270 [Myxococcota bacterium]
MLAFIEVHLHRLSRWNGGDECACGAAHSGERTVLIGQTKPAGPGQYRFCWDKSLPLDAQFGGRSRFLVADPLEHDDKRQPLEQKGLRLPVTARSANARATSHPGDVLLAGGPMGRARKLRGHDDAPAHSALDRSGFSDGAHRERRRHPAEHQCDAVPIASGDSLPHHLFSSHSQRHGGSEGESKRGLAPGSMMATSGFGGSQQRREHTVAASGAWASCREVYTASAFGA